MNFEHDSAIRTGAAPRESLRPSCEIAGRARQPAFEQAYGNPSSFCAYYQSKNETLEYAYLKYTCPHSRAHACEASTASALRTCARTRHMTAPVGRRV